MKLPERYDSRSLGRYEQIDLMQWQILSSDNSIEKRCLEPKYQLGSFSAPGRAGGNTPLALLPLVPQARKENMTLSQPRKAMLEECRVPEKAVQIATSAIALRINRSF